ncbi:MAG: hypothetical protein IJR14_06630 [Synergistaceae bacterium]|nr:hypothetical protein [Synergistaceae bacterium]
MRKIHVAAGALLLIALSVSGAGARYRFDDLYGPSGIGTQWMVITGGGDTVGDKAELGGVGQATTPGQPLDASGDIVSGRYSVEVWNGRSTDPRDEWTNRDIHTMFLVLPERQGSMTVNFKSTYGVVQGAYPNDAVTPDVLVDFRTPLPYNVRKNGGEDAPRYPTGLASVDLPVPYSYDERWRQYELFFDKVRDVDRRYESVRGNFIFHQNPSGAWPSIPSQTLEVPFVVANVYNGTARDEPLVIRSVLREGNNNNGDIVACDRFTWDVLNDKTAGEGQWVFVPVDAWPIGTQNIYHRLTTAVTNHTAIRYTAQRYDSYRWNENTHPSHWKFDLAPTPDLGDLPSKFQLDELSHIAPGLVTVYDQRFDVNQGEKRALRLYSVDPAAGFRELILDHRILFGIDRGDVKGDTLGSRFRNAASWRVTAFDPRTANTPASFLEDVAKQMDAYEPGLELTRLLLPTGSGFLGAGHVKYEYVAGDVIESFAVDRAIPQSMRRAGTEGILPIHVTFNLPKTHLYVSRYWDELLRQWHETADVHDLFAQNFSVFLLSRKEGVPDNPWDLIQEAIEQDVYHDQIKIFMDEDRGVITVSFIVMLMDGTRDGRRPALYLVGDRTATTSNAFMVVRDGHHDDKWRLTFHVAPAGYTDNEEPYGPTSPDVRPKDGGGGGGCEAIHMGTLSILALGAMGLLARRRRG